MRKEQDGFPRQYSSIYAIHDSSKLLLSNASQSVSAASSFL
jgi:hypothetical protein